MSEKNDAFDVFDPTGMVKTMRDASMDAWSKMMVQFVNSDAYAEANGEMLDAWLTSSAPFRKMTEKIMIQSLANLNMPSRDDVLGLAERLTNMELRLDEMEGKLDEVLKLASKPNRGRKATTKLEENGS